MSLFVQLAWGIMHLRSETDIAWWALHCSAKETRRQHCPPTLWICMESCV